jgi:tetratricopeptide (TPR) repeat protein
MRWATTLLLMFIPLALADDKEKADKKALDQQAKQFVKEAKDLEKSGQLLEARTHYTNSQSFTETKDATEAIKRIDGEIRKQVKDALKKSHQLYDKGNFKLAAESLEQAAQQGGSSSMYSYNLALCYRRMGDVPAALGHLDQAVMGTSDPKRKLVMKQLRTAMITGETPAALKGDDRDRINKVNQLIESIGFEASLDEGPPALRQPGDSATSTSTSIPSSSAPKSARRSVSLCQALTAFKGPIADTPAITFNLANCAEDNDRPADAAVLLQHYLEVAPAANDADRVRTRIVKLNELAALPGPAGTQVRGLYASSSRSLESRKYDAALVDFQKSAEVAPEFAPAEWRLALMYESMGNVDEARKHFTLYRKLESNPASQQEADLHLETLDVKRTKYDEEVDRATEILSDLFNRSMNLTFNGMENRAGQHKKLAKERAKVAQKHKIRLIGGFGIPFAYAQQQLAEAGEHLASALVLFPLGAEANQLMALVFLQANDGRASMRAFDAVASQNLPVAFYAEMRGRKQDHAVKCELTRDGLRLIYLSSYDKKAKPTPPAKPAGDDGLGDIVVDPSSERPQDFESLTIKASDIKRIETKNANLIIKLAKEELYISPIYLPAFPPSDGPAGRRFGNNYTRLFVRYPGLEESKLGAEGLSAMEKVKLGYDIANAAYSIAGGLNPMGAIGALETFIQISREVHSVAKSLHVTFAAWLKTIEDEQALLSGNTFKAIPTEAASTVFIEEIK